MKKLILLLTTSVSFSSLFGQSIAGNWEGTLNIQSTEIPIIFHIKDSAGIFSATFDSPKQMAYNLACSGVSQTGDSVILAMAMINGKYEGLLSTDKKLMTGKWLQNGASFPLDMKKTSDVVNTKEFKRPQTPKPPFDYFNEEVNYSNTDKSIQFGGTFTYPMDKVAKKFPCVLLITGSGKQDRDETIFEHKPFAVIAAYLAEHDIASLRVDDRQMGKTTGVFSTSTTADFAADAEAGINYLKSRKDVDTNNIGLIGHSEGGMIAPMIASRRRDIKFIVLLAGPGIPIINLMEQQNVDVASAAGVPTDELEVYRPLYKKIIEAIINEKDPAKATENATAVFNQWQSITAASIVKNTTGVTDDKTKTAFINAFVRQMQTPWFRYFMKFNPQDYLSKVHCAVLALNGQKDIQVAAMPNISAIEKTVVANKLPNYKVQVLPGLNHLFQHCTKCTVDEYAELEETFAPEALQIIGDWIHTVVKEDQQKKLPQRKKH